jgi:hypothetical protein
MAITLNTSVGSVVLQEKWDDYVKGVELNTGPYIKKTYLCKNWSQTDAVVNALLGGATATTIGGQITYRYSHLCPESPDLMCLGAEAIGEVPIDDGAGLRPKFNFCGIRCHYGIPPYNGQAQGDPLNSFTNNDAAGNDTSTPLPFALQSCSISSEFIKVPGSAYKFSSAPQLNVDVPVAMSIGVAEFVIVRQWVPYLPFNTLVQKLNGLNAATMFGQAMGLIKFLGGNTRFKPLPDGTNGQEIELRFKWREYDHNKFHRPDQRAFDFIVDTAGNKPYVYRDLTPLLTS